MTTNVLREHEERLRNVVLPQAMLDYAQGREITPVWLNERGGITARIGDTFFKWNPKGSGLSLGKEVARLKWAKQYANVPEVIAYDRDDEGSWMITKAIENAKSAVDPQWRDDPLTAMRAIGRGLRIFHDSVPVEDCPFDWSVKARGGDEAKAPPVDKPVVCHGDACSPNTLLDSDGNFKALVDMGSMGVADRWADLAVASMSLDWNFEPANEVAFFEAYGIEPDPTRIDYYRWLWDNSEDAHHSGPNAQVRTPSEL